jgi:serine/threonine-protein kinase
MDFSGGAGGMLAVFAVGSRVGAYRLEEQVGAGGMAVVFRAVDERLGRLVALKILAPALAADESFRQRFIRESRAAAAVDDPHIIPVYEAGEADGVLFIAMRYVPSGDVRTMMLRDGPLPPERAGAIISPMASALDAAHGAGLVHRDVKPANMLVDARPGRPDHVYLSDFGLSKGTLSSAGLTGTGQFLGTVDYISPEQIEGKPVDGRADQYALACAAFELLTGVPPFRRDDAMAVIYAQMSAPPPLLTSLRPDLPPEADQVFARALAKARTDRYANCREFAGALRTAIGLARWDSGPGVVPVAAHPATQLARQAAPAVAPVHIPAAGATASGVIPAPGAADMPTGRVNIPAGAPPAGPSYPGPDPGGSSQAQPGRRRRRIAILAGIGVVAVAGIAVAAILASGRGSASFQIAAKSSLRPVTGDVYVVYRGGKDASAQIYGEVKGATRGEVVGLYAQQFPYRSAPVRAGSVVVHLGGATAKYAFQVTPGLATRYEVKLFRNRTATTSLASSATTTVYVTVLAASGNAQACSRPACQETFQVRVRVPASALNTEMSKQWYPYFGLNLAPANEPASPQVLLLRAGAPHITRPQRISRGEFKRTISFTFRIGDQGYSWNWNTCSMATEAKDGIGLPGQHGCGSRSIHVSAIGLVSSPCTGQHCAGPPLAATAAPVPTQAPVPQPTTAPTPTPTPTATATATASAIPTATATGP